MEKTVQIVPSIVVSQSDLAVEIAKGLSSVGLISASANAPGLIPYAQDVYATREIKADPDHNTADDMLKAAEHNAACADARTFIKSRTKAAAIVAPLRDAHAALIKARAAIAARKAA